MKNKSLTPQIRFKGFEDEWQEALVSEKCNFSRGQGYSKRDLKESGHPIFLYGRLYTKYSTFVNNVDTYAALYPFAVLSTGKEIVMPSSGEEADGISVASAILSKDIILGGGLNILLPNQKEIHNPFLALNLTFGSPHKDLAKRAQGKSVVHLYNQDIASVSFNYPCIEEQSFIANYFRKIDEMIAEAEREVSRLEKMKQASLQKMFPRPGATAPEIRFDGFTEPWNVMKLGDILIVNRGGSPRPIETFLTSSENGLNWVKIGDVEKGARYITHTAEKIKPEGLPHTRQVYPGDLILSNSMSFGRPYIMKIKGCIHDGWLLIRDDNKIFDIEFLQQLLGSDNMIRQYKALAAGGVVNNLNSDLVQSSNLIFPSINEQKAIGEYFRNLDSLLSAKRQKLVKLRNIKQACLDKMFVNTSDL